MTVGHSIDGAGRAFQEARALVSWDIAKQVKMLNGIWNSIRHDPLGPVRASLLPGRHFLHNLWDGLSKAQPPLKWRIKTSYCSGVTSDMKDKIEILSSRFVGLAQRFTDVRSVFERTLREREDAANKCIQHTSFEDGDPDRSDFEKLYDAQLDDVVCRPAPPQVLEHWRKLGYHASICNGNISLTIAALPDDDPSVRALKESEHFPDEDIAQFQMEHDIGMTEDERRWTKMAGIPYRVERTKDGMEHTVLSADVPPDVREAFREQDEIKNRALADGTFWDDPSSEVAVLWSKMYGTKTPKPPSAAGAATAASSTTAPTALDDEFRNRMQHHISQNKAKHKDMEFTAVCFAPR